MAIREHEAIDLRLNVLNLDARETLNTGHVNLVVEVADVHRDEAGEAGPKVQAPSYAAFGTKEPWRQP